MRAARIALGIMGVLALLGWVSVRFWPTNQRVVESRLNTLAEVFSFPRGESVFLQTIRTYKITGFFDEDVEVDLSGVYFDFSPWRQGGVVKGRDELRAQIISIPENFREFKVEFADMLVKVSPDGEKASAYTSALASGRWKGGERRGEFSMAQELKFELKRTGARWGITRVVTYKTLQ